MKIRNEFRLEVPLESVWDAINDIPRIARCAPGAELLESRDDNSHIGTIGVRLGPVALKFKGTVTFVDKDPVAHRILAKAKGNEEKARGTASADVVFTLAPDGLGTHIAVASDIQLAGAIAQYGRGTALIQGTAQVLMDQFARNLEADLNALRDVDKAPERGPPKNISVARVLVKAVWNAGVGLFNAVLRRLKWH